MPYTWLNPILCNISGVFLLLSFALLGWAFFRKRGQRKKLLLTSLVSFLTCLAFGAATYALIFSVQLPSLRPDVANLPGTLTAIGESVPEFSLTTLDGKLVNPAEMQGKVLLVNFFATWCPPCRRELPHLQKIWETFGQHQDFAMLVIGWEENDETLVNFRSQEEFTFPMASDPKSLAFGKFANGGIPRTYLIARDGTIIYQCAGFYEEEIEKLRQLIETTLSKP
jgi:peroxiredoxin